MVTALQGVFLPAVQPLCSYLQYSLYQCDGFPRARRSKQDVGRGPTLPRQDPLHRFLLKGVELAVEELAWLGNGSGLLA